MTRTQQPEWRLVYQTDCETLLVDATGVYPPELVILDACEEDFTAYRAILPRCALVGDALAPHWCAAEPQLAGGHKEWFSDDVPACAHTCGMEPDEVRKLLCSADPKERAHGYATVAAHFGWYEFDSYPLRFTGPDAGQEVTAWWDRLAAVPRWKGEQ